MSTIETAPCSCSAQHDLKLVILFLISPLPFEYMDDIKQIINSFWLWVMLIILSDHKKEKLSRKTNSVQLSHVGCLGLLMIFPVVFDIFQHNNSNQSHLSPYTSIFCSLPTSNRRPQLYQDQSSFLWRPNQCSNSE